MVSGVVDEHIHRLYDFKTLRSLYKSFSALRRDIVAGRSRNIHAGEVKML